MTIDFDQRVAAYAVIVRDDAILLSHWAHGDLWTLPGGGLDPGEHPAAATIREVEEETGFTVRLDELLGVDSLVTPAEMRVTHRDRPLHSIRIVYRGSVTSGELRHEAHGSSDEARWVPLEELDRIARVTLVDTAMRMSPQRVP